MYVPLLGSKDEMESLLHNTMEEEDEPETEPETEPEETPPPKKGMTILYRQLAVLTIHGHALSICTCMCS